jgi:hypothetical protein
MGEHSGRIIARRIIATEAIRNQLENLEETIGSLHRLSLATPRDAKWNEVRDVVICLDSIADVMRQALDSMQGFRVEGGGDG